MGKAKEHYEIFLMPVGCVEGCLALITLSYADQVISIATVKLGEDVGPLKQLKGRRDNWQGLEAFDGDVVQTSVVCAGSQSLIFPLHKEDSYPG